ANANYDTDDLKQAAINAYWANYAKNHDITVVKRIWKAGEFTQDDICSKLPLKMVNSQYLQTFFENYFNDTNTFIITFGEHTGGYNQWFYNGLIN
ncbi:MAG: hypothetical protein GX660_23105, partial [Clostridiaceae bacterium]|nr:hypothetical protein [Clostridiaceae bacterium]